MLLFQVLNECVIKEYAFIFALLIIPENKTKWIGKDFRFCKGCVASPERFILERKTMKTYNDLAQFIISALAQKTGIKKGEWLSTISTVVLVQ